MSLLHLDKSRPPESPATHPLALLAQIVPSVKAPSWENLLQLEFWDLTLPTATAFERLLCALPALGALTIDGACTFSEHDFNPTNAPVYSDMLSRYKKLTFGKDFSLRSDPQSVHDLVDILVQPGLGDCLREVSAWLSPSLHVTTSIDVAFNRLVKHAGPELYGLRLKVLPLNSLPLLNEAYAYAAPTTGAPPNIVFATLPTVTHYLPSP